METKTNSKIKSVIVSALISGVFFIYALKPGAINLLGYAVSVLIFGQNSETQLKYEGATIFIFDILCSLVIFWIVFRLMRKFLS